MDIPDGVKYSFAAVIGIIAGIWVGLGVVLQVLLAMMVVDVVTGMLAAGVQGKLDSTKGWWGVTKRKFGTLAVVACAELIEPLLGGVQVGAFVTGFYVAVEFLSIIENVGLMGVPVPNFLIQAVRRLKDAMDNGGIVKPQPNGESK